MIFDFLGTFLEPPGKWSPGARDGALELLATISYGIPIFSTSWESFWKNLEPWSSKWSPGARNGALDLEMEPWTSNWSPGLRNKLPRVGLNYKTIAWDYPVSPGVHWQPFLKEFIDFQVPGNLSSPGFPGPPWVSSGYKVRASADPIAKN